MWTRRSKISCVNIIITWHETLHLFIRIQTQNVIIIYGENETEYMRNGENFEPQFTLKENQQPVCVWVIVSDRGLLLIGVSRSDAFPWSRIGSPVSLRTNDVWSVNKRSVARTHSLHISGCPKRNYQPCLMERSVTSGLVWILNSYRLHPGSRTARVSRSSSGYPGNLKLPEPDNSRHKQSKLLILMSLDHELHHNMKHP